MIIPAILEQDMEEVKRKISLVENVANLVQIDIADGKLVKGTTLLDFSALDEIETNCVFEIHLMVENPLDYLEPKLKKVIKISSQIETSEHTNRSFITKAKELGYKVGLSIKEETELSELEPYMDQIDYVQFVAVEPGAQGRPFDPKVTDRIKQLRKSHPHIYIQVDGGIDDENLVKILEAGANDAVIGSHIFESPSPEQAVLNFKKLGVEYANRT